MPATAQIKEVDHGADQSVTMTKSYKKYFPDTGQDNLHGFIHHPAGIPIEIRRIWFDSDHDDPFMEEQGNIGVCFESDKYIKPGTIIEITIPVRNETQKFRGKVVLVKNKEERYIIGLWLTRKSDAGRVRIVEQICHIEAYLRHKRHYEGPFVSRERVAEEWITRFAATFPTI